MSSTADKDNIDTSNGPVKPEGQEESEKMARETEGGRMEMETEKIEKLETEHEKAKRRKRGNNTQ